MLRAETQLRKYYIGEGTDHVIELTENEAFAVINLRLEHVQDDIYRVNLTDAQMMDYESGSAKLNRYINQATTPVRFSEEYLLSNDILRPV